MYIRCIYIKPDCLCYVGEEKVLGSVLGWPGKPGFTIVLTVCYSSLLSRAAADVMMTETSRDSLRATPSLGLLSPQNIF